MKKIFFCLMILGALSSCSRDPSANDLRSPCAAASDGIFIDASCTKRIPVENNAHQYIIAVS